jgi:membrane protein
VVVDAKVAERAGRGRDATSPAEIPVSGWRDIFWRIWYKIDTDNLSVVAAGVAFFSLLGLFPLLAALVSLYGLVADPVDVKRQLAYLYGVIPTDAIKILDDQLTTLTSKPKAELGVPLIGSLMLALWSSTQGVKALMSSLNVIYAENEKRSFFRFSLVALAFNLGAIAFLIVALTVIVAVPAVLAIIGLDRFSQNLLTLVWWPFLALAVMFGLAVLYRYGPSRNRARWRWVTWGAVFATVLWLAVSALFSFYVSRFADYDQSYGSLGAAVILLMWFYVSAFAVLLGAELNAEAEHQTIEDSTEGKAKPLGRRGARMADTIGKQP